MNDYGRRKRYDHYATSNADSVEISGIGSEMQHGNSRRFTHGNHDLHADGPQSARPGNLQRYGPSHTGTAPRVVRFTADPATITSGNASTLELDC